MEQNIDIIGVNGKLKPVEQLNGLTAIEIAAIIFDCEIESVKDAHFKLCGAPVFANDNEEIVFFEGSVEDAYTACKELEAEIDKQGLAGCWDASIMSGNAYQLKIAYQLEIKEFDKVVSVFQIKG